MWNNSHWCRYKRHHLESWNKKFYSDTCFIVSHILHIIRTISILGWDCETIIIIINNYIFHLKPRSWIVQWTDIQWDDTVWRWPYVTYIHLNNILQLKSLMSDKKKRFHFYLQSSNGEVTQSAMTRCVCSTCFSSAQWTDIYVRMFPLIHHNVIDIFLNCYFHKSKF